MATASMQHPHVVLRALCVSLILASPLACLAQPAAPPLLNVVALEASATAEVPADTLAVTLFTEEQGPDPADLAARANARLEQALAKAKADPAIEARSGNYQTAPLYDRANQITGWRLRAELVLESRDFKAVGALAGRLQPGLKLAGMSFSLSRAARESSEASLLGDALRKFQAKAEAIAKAMGFPGYTLGQIAVRSESAIAQPVAYRMAATALADGAGPPPPMEGGKNAVTIVVSGSVVLGPAR